MKELTFADLMALDYWQDKCVKNKQAAKMLGMSEFNLDNAIISEEFNWAVEIILSKNIEQLIIEDLIRKGK